jgi:hypothetical protein
MTAASFLPGSAEVKSAASQPRDGADTTRIARTPFSSAQVGELFVGIEETDKDTGTVRTKQR